MSDPERDDAIAARARALLDRASDELDADTRARLRAARLRALERVGARRTRRAALAAAGVGAAAAAAVAALLLRPARETDSAGAFAEAFEDFEILGAADDLELYDDLEFYRWLEENEPI